MDEYSKKMDEALSAFIENNAAPSLGTALDLYECANDDDVKASIKSSIENIIRSAYWCGVSSQIANGTK